MKKHHRYAVVGILAALWLVALAAIRILLAPVVGAAVVNQVDASNASFYNSLAIVAGATNLSIIVTLIFVGLVIAVVRST